MAYNIICDQVIDIDIQSIYSGKALIKVLFLRSILNFVKPEECFFIDDLERNIQGAKACGMDGYCFADGDRERLKIRLASLKKG